MIEYLNQFENFKMLLPIPLLIIASLIIKFVLEYIGSHWIINKSNYYTIFLLPQIAFVITKVISGNIALSLGMIGALSIVRFRHPVKSPFELTIYFSLITLGISMSVSINWGLVLIVVMMVVIIGIYIFLKNDNKTNFHTSDSDIILEVQSKKTLEILNNSSFLKNSIEDKVENKFTYRLVFEEKLSMQNILDEISSDKDIIKIYKTFN